MVEVFRRPIRNQSVSSAQDDSLRKNSTPPSKLTSDVRCPAPAHLLLHAGIVSGIDVIDLKRRRSVDLDYRLTHRHSVMMHAGIEVGEAAGREHAHLGHIETVPHAYLKAPRDDRHVFALG